MQNEIVETKPHAVVELTNEILSSVVEEIEAAAIEKNFEANQARVELYWHTGEILRVAEQQHHINITELVGKCAEDNRVKGQKMGLTSLWFSIKVYDTFPRMDSLPWGKATTVTKLKKYLNPPADKKDETWAEVAQKLLSKYGVDGLKAIRAEIDVLIAHNPNEAEV